MQTRRWAFRGPGLVLTLVMLLAGMGLVASPATSTPGTDDYPSRLRSAGRDALVDQWMFYNRECTSFVAWRLHHDNWGLAYGAKNAFWNYYKGQHWGNANHWATAARNAGIRVDTTPRVGAVAYWLSGSFGHVAWVRSFTRTSVTIEEYNYVHYGGYSTRTMTRGASNYPTGFIHVRDLGNTSRPRISGTPQVGQTLTARRGSWVLPGASYSYQWLVDGSVLTGATGRTFTPTADQTGARISVRVTGRKPGLAAMRATSARTAAVLPNAITNQTQPSVTGTPQVGQPLTADPGTWSVQGATYAYQWTADGQPVAGATDSTFTPGADQLGRQVAVEVTASARGYQSAIATSAPTGPVASGTIENQQAPAVTGTPQLGSTLRADPGQWSVQPSSYDYEWLADGVTVPNADGATLVPDSSLLAKHISVKVVAAAPGYVDQTALSQPSAAVAPGTIEVSSGPTVRHSPVVGNVLRSAVGSISTPGVTVRRQWLRDGSPISGATTAGYTPRRADIGHRLAMRLTLSKVNFATRQETSAWSAPVRVTPWLTGRQDVASHQLGLDIQVGARRAPAPTGRVLVYLDSQLVRRPYLQDAEAVVQLRRLDRGWHTVQLRYVGDRYHTTKRATMRTWIPN